MLSREEIETLIEVRASPIQGLGVFARRPIAEGTRLIEYAGEVISEAEGDARYEEAAMARHHTYLMALEDGRCIDAAVGGNESRFINHSCEPNCEAVEEDGRVWIETLEPIAAGQELTYDYAYERAADEDEAFYQCGCGASRCRRTILAPRDPVREGR
jgi:SET domain-containing protein